MHLEINNKNVCHKTREAILVDPMITSNPYDLIVGKWRKKHKQISFLRCRNC